MVVAASQMSEPFEEAFHKNKALYVQDTGKGLKVNVVDIRIFIRTAP